MRDTGMRATGTTSIARAALLECAGDGTPIGMDWDRRRWAVTDSPTRLEDALGMLLTHPLPITGWRFQGTALEGGESWVFDVLRFDGAWCVVRAYR